MAILDANAQFCDASTITATVANAIVGNVYDTGSAPTTKDIGLGAKPMYLVLSIDEAVTSNGSATVTFTLLSDSTADLATSATTHLTTGAIAKATLVQGYTADTPEGQEFVQNLAEQFLSLGKDSDAAVKGLEALGFNTDEITEKSS